MSYAPVYQELSIAQAKVADVGMKEFCRGMSLFDRCTPFYLIYPPFSLVCEP
jgi:hypothetical protein